MSCCQSEEITFLELGILQQALVQRNIGFDPLDHHFGKGITHPCQGDLTGFTVAQGGRV